MNFLRQNRLYIYLLIILGLAVLAGFIDRPSAKPFDFKKLNISRDLKIHQGLDLKGGVHLVYEGDFSKIDPKDYDQAHQGLVNVIEKRVNALGVSEPLIQKGQINNKKTVIIELPGIKDVNEAMKLIGQTAQLTFLEQRGESWTETSLTGANLKKAEFTIDTETGNPKVNLQFDDQGAKLFKEITERNLQKTVAIKLDENIITAPTVQTVISDGKAEITGQFTVKEAKDLALSLNSGALPVPLTLIAQSNISASLGPDSIKKSIIAGLLGILMVMIFMISYYRFPGVLASIALLIYTLIILALFKLIPVVLTLSGIAGFILSVGMAVDANILIFERMKEELREGKPQQASIIEGFRRAWLSIRDSNVSSLITCLILIWLGSGLVRGFAVTLAIGILVSMFTAITITRTFLLLFSKLKQKREEVAQ